MNESYDEYRINQSKEQTVIIYYRDGVVWFEKDYTPIKPEDDILLHAVTNALPMPPKRVRVNRQAYYERIATGFVSAPGEGITRHAEYSLNVEDFDSAIPDHWGR